MKKIGFIGVGIMGKSMVRNLMKAGYELHIFARHKEKVEDVIAEGAVFHETIKDCVTGCDAVITIVGFPKDVEEVYFEEGNILDSVKEATVVRRQGRCPSSWEENRKIMRPVCRFLKPWERISIIREAQDVASMPKWPIRL